MGGLRPESKSTPTCSLHNIGVSCLVTQSDSCTIVKAIGGCVVTVRLRSTLCRPSGTKSDVYCTSLCATSFLHTLQTLRRTAAWQPAGQHPNAAAATIVFCVCFLACVAELGSLMGCYRSWFLAQVTIKIVIQSAHINASSNCVWALCTWFVRLCVSVFSLTLVRKFHATVIGLSWRLCGSIPGLHLRN